MDAFIQDPLFYWIIWTIATIIGILLGWTLRANWREKAVWAAYNQMDEERRSIAHMYNQIRQQHDQKTAELKRLSLEANHLRQQVSALEVNNATREAVRETEALRLVKAEQEATLYLEKIQLLEENIKLLRLRDQQFGSEIIRLQEELQGWKKIQRDFSGMLTQIQALEQRSAQMEKERTALIRQLELSKVEISNLQNSLALANASAEGDSDQSDLTHSS